MGPQDHQACYRGLLVLMEDDLMIPGRLPGFLEKFRKQYALETMFKHVGAQTDYMTVLEGVVALMPVRGEEKERRDKANGSSVGSSPRRYTKAGDIAKKVSTFVAYKST